MKFWYKFLFLPVFILALVGCEKDQKLVYLAPIETEDGKVTQLQKHTIGKGVPIVIMGERFTESDIKYGRYRKATNWALEGLFSMCPMFTLRDYFDVYEVTAVSFANKSEDTAFSSDFSGRTVSGDYNKAVEYAKKAIGEERIDDATIIILINQDIYGGSCYMDVSYTSYVSDIPKGCAVAFVSLEGYDVRSIKHYSVLLHEAIGHGFAKLADEYVDDVFGPVEADKEWLMEYQSKGYYRNISYDSDVTKSCWADFAADSRYNSEKLGCYEGAQYIDTGAYRATENSIMRLLDSDFNVVGRSMIYKRCLKIAYGDSWKFNYEDFVKFDLEGIKAEHEEIKKQYPDYSKSMRSCAPPRFVKMKASR